MKNDNEEKIERLLRSAARSGEEEISSLPFGFDTRVVALWRAAANKPNGLAALLRRVALLSTAVIVVAAAAGVREISQSREASESFSNEFAIADSAIQSEFLK